MPDNIVNLHGDPIQHVIDLEEDAMNALRQRLLFIAQAEHTLNSMRLEMQAHIQQNHPETQGATNIQISSDGSTITYS